MKAMTKKLQLNKNTTRSLSARTGIKAGAPRNTGISCDGDCPPTVHYSDHCATAHC